MIRSTLLPGLLCWAAIALADDPPDSAELLQAFEQQVRELDRIASDRHQADAKAYDARFESLRQSAMQRLDELQKTAASENRLDDAITIRDAKGTLKNQNPQFPFIAASRHRAAVAQSDRLAAKVRELLGKNPPPPPKEAITWQGHHYLVVAGSESYPVAMLKASQAGGNLVKMQDKAERQFLIDVCKPLETDAIYIGGSDYLVEDDFVYEDGSPVTFLPWIKTAPNNSLLGRGRGENAISLYVRGSATGQINDVVGDTRRPYIIEWDR